MNDQQFQEWLDAHGGEVGRKNNEKQEDGPADPNTGAPVKRTVIDSTTITAKDGATITLRRQPGPINGGQAYEVIATEPPKPAATAAASTRPPIPPGGSSATEGTPLPDGTWDNNRPRQVIKDANGTVVWSEELTGTDLTAWRNNQQAGQPQTGEVRKPVEGRPGWTSVTRTTTQGGNKTESTVYVGPDGKEVPTLPEQTSTVRVPVDGHPGVYLVTSRQGQSQSSHYENEAGQTVPQPAAAPTYTVRHETKNGQTYTIVTKTPKDGSPPTISNFGPDGKPIERLPEEGAFDVPPGMPTLDTSSADAAHKSYLAAYQWAQQQIGAGKLTVDRAKTILAPMEGAAKSVIDRDTQRQTQANNERTQGITLEGNRATAASTFFSNADKATTDVWKVAPRGGTQAADVMMGSLLLQQLMARGGPAGTAGALPSPTGTMPAMPNPAALSEIGQAGDPVPTSVVTPEMVAPTGIAAIDAATAEARRQRVAGAAANVGPERAAEIRANPAFRPTAPVGTPVFQNTEGTFGLPGMLGAPNPPVEEPQALDPTGMPGAVQYAMGRSLIDELMAGRRVA